MMAAWVCGDESTPDARNPFVGMQSATIVPQPDDGDDTASHWHIIHPATLSSTSVFLSHIVALLAESRPTSPDDAHDNLLTKAKHMFDMTRVLKNELPADAALERL
jgi:hypothetical protein